MPSIGTAIRSQQHDRDLKHRGEDNGDAEIEFEPRDVLDVALSRNRIEISSPVHLIVPQ